MAKAPRAVGAAFPGLSAGGSGAGPGGGGPGAAGAAGPARLRSENGLREQVKQLSSREDPVPSPPARAEAPLLGEETPRVQVQKQLNILILSHREVPADIALIIQYLLLLTLTYCRR